MLLHQTSLLEKSTSPQVMDNSSALTSSTLTQHFHYENQPSYPNLLCISSLLTFLLEDQYPNLNILFGF